MSEQSPVLPQTPDAGEIYQHSTLFIGDSNTVAMQDYGLLPPQNVFAVSGIGVQQLLSGGILGGAPAALAGGTWRRALVTIGTNDLGYLPQRAFIDSYCQLLGQLRQAAPGTDIIVNAIPPQRPGWFSEGGRERLVPLCNAALQQLCLQTDTPFLNSFEVMANEEGQSLPDMTVEDGIHLTTKALKAVLHYHRTHAHRP